MLQLCWMLHLFNVQLKNLMQLYHIQRKVTEFLTYLGKISQYLLIAISKVAEINGIEKRSEEFIIFC